MKTTLLKLSLILLSVLGSLTSYCQYPQTSTIDGQDVVIMTVDQASDINNLFIMYNDSIKNLNEIIWRQRYDVKFAERQLEISNEIGRAHV